MQNLPQKRFAHTVIVILACMIALSLQPVKASAKTAEARSITLSKKSVSLTPDKNITLKATIKPKNSTRKKVIWTSSKKSVATVNSKGIVKAKKNGTAIITAAISGTNQKAVCNVTVTTPVSKVQISGKSSVKVGSRTTLTAKITPDSASNKSVTWSSSDPAIAKVNSKGKVTGISTGTVTITATAKDGSKKTASRKISVNAADTEKETTNEPITEQPESAVVKNQSELDEALTALQMGTIIIQTDAAEDIVIPPGSHPDIALIADSPKARIINQASFRQITITSGAEGSFTEKAVGNTITVQSDQADVTIDTGASASVIIAETVTAMQIKENGIIASMSINGSGTIDITGTSAGNTPIETSISGTAKVVTTKPLNLTTETTPVLVLRAGAEESKLTIKNKENMPVIQGLQMITVTVTDTSEELEILPNELEEQYRIQMTFTGNAKDAVSSADIPGTAYLAEYIPHMNIEAIDTLSDVRTSELTNGTYSFAEVKEGSYVLLITSPGYKHFIQFVTISSRYGDVCINEDARMTASYEDAKKAQLSGYIKNSINKHAISGLTIQLRRHKNDKVSDVIRETITDKDGYYIFTDLPADNYTITVVDQRRLSAKFITASFHICVIPGEYAEKGIALTEEMDDSTVRFVLSWGSKTQGVCPDLDAYLYGPTGLADELFQVNFMNKKYSVNGITDALLDVDEMDYNGPETITIRNVKDGKYYYYVGRYSQEGTLGTSKIQVDVYKGNKLLDTFHPNADCTQANWNVFVYDSVTNQITPVNRGEDIREIEQNANIITNGKRSILTSVEPVCDPQAKAALKFHIDEMKLSSNYLTLQDYLTAGNGFTLQAGTLNLTDYRISYKGEEDFKSYGDASSDAILISEVYGEKIICQIQYRTNLSVYHICLTDKHGDEKANENWNEGTAKQKHIYVKDKYVDFPTAVKVQDYQLNCPVTDEIPCTPVWILPSDANYQQAASACGRKDAAAVLKLDFGKYGVQYAAIVYLQEFPLNLMDAINSENDVKGHLESEWDSSDNEYKYVLIEDDYSNFEEAYSQENYRFDCYQDIPYTTSVILPSDADWKQFTGVTGKIDASAILKVDSGADYGIKYFPIVYHQN